MKGALAGGEPAMREIIMVTHAGMTTAEFEQIVKDWIATAKHPKFKRPYTECVYQPMVELLAYLRANGFKTFIVSGGGIEFMRPWTEKVYGIPPEQVVGSSIKTKYEMARRQAGAHAVAGDQLHRRQDRQTGRHQLTHWPPAHRRVRKLGRRPANAGVDAGRRGARLMMLVHHDDAVREFAYGAESKIGTFSDALMAEAKKNSWTVISMKDDWKKIFSFEQVK